MRIQLDQGDEGGALEVSAGQLRVGGAAEDDLIVAGLPSGALILREHDDQLVIRSAVAVRVGGVLSPPAVARLLTPGDPVELVPGVTLRAWPQEPAARPIQTVALAQELFSGEPPSAGRCPALVCLTGLDIGRRFALAQAEVELGRGAGADVRVRDRAVSRRHAKVTRRPDGHFWVEDLRSPNGVYVDGARVLGAAELRPGAVIELGHCLLRFDPGEDPPKSAPLDWAQGERSQAGGPPSLEREPSTPVGSHAPGFRFPELGAALVGLAVFLVAAGALVGWGLLPP
jgi:hypothetical protein